MRTNLLSVKNLSIGYETKYGMVTAVDNISFEVGQGRPLGLVGESGCGKTTIGMTLMGLLPVNGRVLSGTMDFCGSDLALLTEKQWRKVRGKKLAMIFQAAMNALNPVYRVGDQVKEAIVCHNPGMAADQIDARLKELFELVEIPMDRARDFPHEYSGGMKQRVVIAMALACSPRLVIADEPTTALDVIVQDQILEGLRLIQARTSTGLIFISHDIGVVASVCDDVCVMYGGQIVEKGASDKVFSDPRHPYSQILFNSYLSLDNVHGVKIPEMRGTQDFTLEMGHCRFAPNCPWCKGDCRTRKPGWINIAPDHSVFCCDEQQIQKEGHCE